MSKTQPPRRARAVQALEVSAPDTAFATALATDIQRLIDGARQRLAVAVNAELTLLYWQVGTRIRQDVLGAQRADYGTTVVASLAARLTAAYGRGWSEKQLWHCLRVAETFPDAETLSALRRELSWTHIKTLMYVDDPLKRDFYAQLCQLERWSVRQLQERLQSLLFERSALSRQPEETIRHELQALRQEEAPSPALLLKDPPGTSVKTPVKTPVKTRAKTPDRILEALGASPNLTLTELVMSIGKSVSAVERASAKLVKEGRLKYVARERAANVRFCNERQGAPCPVSPAGGNHPARVAGVAAGDRDGAAAAAAATRI